MFYLLETPVGLALFKKEIENPILCDKMKFKSVQEAIELYREFSNGTLPQQFKNFISSNVNSSSTLNIPNQEIGIVLSRELNLKIVNHPDEAFKIVNKNPFKWFDVSKDCYNALTAKLAFKFTNSNHEDLIVSDLLSTIEELEKSINNRIMRAREWYSLHFPELNTVSDHSTYLSLVLKIGNRHSFVNEPNSPIPEDILYQLKNSMGCDITVEDMNKISENIKNIFRDIEYKSKQQQLLKTKTSSSFPNLYNLIGEVLTAKLIRKAGSITLLSQSTSSTIQIYGSEKAFHEAVKSQMNTPKYGFIYDSDLVSRVTDDIKGKVARILANKIALCARVDSELSKNDGSFGVTMRIKIEKEIEKLEDRKNKVKKSVLQKKKKVLSVKEYDSSRDFKNNKK